MRIHEHDSEESLLRPKSPRMDPRPPAEMVHAAAAGRSDVLDAASILRLQRAVGNGGVGALLEEQRSPVHNVVKSGGGSPLAPDIHAEMSARLGHDFSDVRVHTDSQADDSARSVNNVSFQQRQGPAGSSSVQRAPTPETEPPPYSGMSKVAELDEFLNATKAAWYHAGGYAMLRWCKHYDMATVETNDLDIFINPHDFNRVHQELFGVPPEQLNEKRRLDGYAVSLNSFSGNPARYMVDRAPLISPEVLMSIYGGGTTEGTEKAEEKPSIFEELRAQAKTTTAGRGQAAEALLVTGAPEIDSDVEKDKQEREAKHERRSRRKGLMGELLANFHKEAPKEVVSE